MTNQVSECDIYKLPEEEKIKFIKKLIPDPDLSGISGNFDIILNSNYSTQLVAPYFLWREDVNIKNSIYLQSEVSKLTELIQKKIFEQIF